MQQFSAPLTSTWRHAIRYAIDLADTAENISLTVEAGEALTIPAAQSQFICQVGAGAR